MSWRTEEREQDGADVPDHETAQTDFIPGPETARSFRDALGRYSTGVTVVTTHGPQGPVGVTANSFAAVSLDPPLVLWSPAKSSRRCRAFTEATDFSIHVLAADQIDICRHFTQPDDHFSGLDVTLSPEGTPLIQGVLARFDCRTETTHDAGDHIIVIGRVLRAFHRAGAPLVFSQGRYGTFAARD